MERLDFSPYNHGLPFALENVLNVGWIDITFSKKGVIASTQAIASLEKMILRESVNVLRCIKVCPICQTEGEWRTIDASKVFLGTAEVWVPSTDGKTIFAAPDLILHYIANHGYSPPVEFVSALAGFDFLSDWSGESIRKELIHEGFRKLEMA